jgi:hypothetical protein
MGEEVEEVEEEAEEVAVTPRWKSWSPKTCASLPGGGETAQAICNRLPSTLLRKLPLPHRFGSNFTIPIIVTNEGLH